LEEPGAVVAQELIEMSDSKRAGFTCESPTFVSVAGLQVLAQAVRLVSGHRANVVGDTGEVAGARSSRATFYVYFKDKSQLLGYFAEQVLTEVADAVRELWTQRGTASPDHMRRAVRDVITTYRKHQQILTAITGVAHYTPEIDEIYRALIDRNAGYTREFLDREQAAGRVRALDSAETARVITWMVERCCAQMLREPPGRGRQAACSTLAQMIWAAIYLDDPGFGQR
jgi:TetR/AcrR family transcriptional regulator, ethionamide resistance regulator